MTVFNRGTNPNAVPEGVQQLVGDRNSDLESIIHKHWDAVIDVAAYDPMWVHNLGVAMSDQVDHYTFVSSIAVYLNPPKTGKESDELKPSLDETDVSHLSSNFAGLSLEQKRRILDAYGARKAMAESEAQRQFPDRTLILRPGTLVGRGDNTNHLYWFIRLSQGGEVLVPGNPEDPFQYIDIHDLAMWTTRMIEDGMAGIFNALGPTTPVNWGMYIDAIAAQVSTNLEIVYVPSAWLLSRGVQQTELPLWFPFPEAPAPGVLEWASMRMNNEKACAHGLSFRPMEQTIAEAMSWIRTGQATMPKGWGMDPRRERDLLDEWMASR